MIPIDNSQIPRHIAIIMDGNGRWAKNKSLPRLAGHREGVKTVRRITEICSEIGVEVLTLYTFSEENWNRPPGEVIALMKLLVSSLRKEVKELDKNNVRFTVIGNIKKMDASVQLELQEAINTTKNNSGLNLNLALSYGGRQEILNAVNLYSKDILNGKTKIENLDEFVFSKYLYTRDIQDPDLLIRTGGEMRISNFLLWQIAYSELHITNTFWPAFDRGDLYKAISEFQNCERRFGKISEQVKHDS
jgi:undecaprenyl diphosphate synthase